MHKFIRPSVDADVSLLAPLLRAADAAEAAVFGLDPETALSNGLKHSDICLTALDYNMVPMAMYGVAPVPGAPHIGAVWLLGSDEIEHSSKLFARYSRDALAALFNAVPYQALYNVTHGKNVVHHRWLRWVGFQFQECPVIVNGEPFYAFIKLRG